jgi:hypothetical protein
MGFQRIEDDHILEFLWLLSTFGYVARQYRGKQVTSRWNEPSTITVFHTNYSELPNLPIIKESQTQIYVYLYAYLFIYTLIPSAGGVHGLVLIKIMYR